MLGFASQKGGVGKTTSCVNLGAALGARGHRVVVVDLDPQANATTALGRDASAVQGSAYDLLLSQASADDVVLSTGVERLDLVPSSLDLAGAEIELAGAPDRERRLARALAGVAGYDLVLVDCPPSLGLLTVNALVAADDVIVPVQCEFYALEAVARLMSTAERVRAALNPNLRVGGFLLTMYDFRTRLSAQVADEVRRHFGAAVFEVTVPRNVRLSEAPSYGRPAVTLDPGSRGARAYRLLAEEVERRFTVGAAPSVAPEEDDEVRLAPAPPRGRGYGNTAPEPPELESVWPRGQPWTADAQAGRRAIPSRPSAPGDKEPLGAVEGDTG